MNLISRIFRPKRFTFNRLVLEGRAVLDPELAKEYERVYWAERTWGMSNDEVREYLKTRLVHIIDAGDTLQ